MLIVSRSEIEAAIDTRSLSADIEAAYVAMSAGEFELPPVGHLAFPAVRGDCHIKFGHRRGDGDFVIKVATGFPNQAALGEPVGNGVFLVMSATTGQVRAVLHDEMLLTDVRTAIGGAIASRRLGRADAQRLLIVGTGAQARRQLAAHLELLDRPLAVAVWGRSPDSAARVLDDVDAPAHSSVSTDLAEACRAADLIVTATDATSPIIDADWIEPGTHITAVGADAPGKHELDAELVGSADLLVADSISQCLDHGELSAIAHDQRIASRVVELGELLTTPTIERSDSDITIADLTGVAALDIAAAQHVLHRLDTFELSAT